MKAKKIDDLRIAEFVAFFPMFIIRY